MRIFLTVFFFFLIFSKYNLLAVENNEICRIATKKVEKKLKLPNKLLTSISLVETGRFVKNQHRTWPWSVNVEGRSHYFKDKQSMLKFLKIQIKNNVTNFDVGCMQINFRYHIKKESNLKLFIDPNYNVIWAGNFLKQLQKKYKSWNKAISRYHSSDKLRMKIYLNKVHKVWKDQRQIKEIIFSQNKFKKDQEDKNQNNFFSKSFYLKNKLKIDFFRKELNKEPKNFQKSKI